MKTSCFLPRLFATGFCAMISGCGSSAAPPVSVSETASPQSFVADSKTWTRKTSMEKSDEAVLTKFFTTQTDFQGSTDFEGTPTLFLAGKSDRRFYWLRGTGNAAIWSCVRFEGGRFQVSEGKGNLF